MGTLRYLFLLVLYILYIYRHNLCLSLLILFLSFFHAYTSALCIGIKAIQLNVHYTDGTYEDPTLKTFKMAVDGIKIYYTSDLREYTSISKEIIYVPFGPAQLYVPPGVDRYFLARTCTVDTKCKDSSDDTLQLVAAFFGNDNEDESAPANSELANMSCPSVKQFCLMPEIGPSIQQVRTDEHVTVMIVTS